MKKVCHEPKGNVREVKITLVSYRDASGRFVCSPKAGKAPVKLEPIRAKLKAKSVSKAREKGVVSQAWGEGATVRYKYRINSKAQRVGLSITGLTLRGELGREYAKAIRGKDKQTRQSAVRFKRDLVTDAKRQLLEELKLEESNKDLTSSVRRESGQRAARTKAGKKAAGKVKPGVSVSEAKTQVKLLVAKILALNVKMNRSRSPKVLETLRKRRTKLVGFKSQFEKIMVGKAKNAPKGWRG
jgi:hypothetical protein